MSGLDAITSMHDRVFASVERHADAWALGLAARLVFLAVLFFYFFSSFGTKVGEGLSGLLMIQDSAYYQILPPIVEAAGGDIQAIGVFPWGLVVAAGTYAELLLPLLIVLGLFTRLASLGMIGFILVQSFVDIVFHKVDASTIGGLFDRFPDSLILDQRLLWIFLLATLAAKGAGAISLDALLPGAGRSQKALPA